MLLENRVSGGLSVLIVGCPYGSDLLPPCLLEIVRYALFFKPAARRRRRRHDASAALYSSPEVAAWEPAAAATTAVRPSP